MADLDFYKASISLENVILKPQLLILMTCFLNMEAQADSDLSQLTVAVMDV